MAKLKFTTTPRLVLRKLFAWFEYNLTPMLQICIVFKGKTNTICFRKGCSYPKLLLTSWNEGMISNKDDHAYIKKNINTISTVFHDLNNMNSIGNKYNKCKRKKLWLRQLSPVLADKFIY